MAVPYPIATLIRHATTTKSPRESHGLTFSAWEASLRFAVAAQNSGDVLKSSHPTVADWIAALPPELKNDAQLNVPALMSVNRLFCETSGKNAADTSVTAKHLFSLIPPYRDCVAGSDSTQTPEFFNAATPVLAAGLDAAWEANVFGTADSQLVFVEKIEHDPAGERLGRVVLLIGETPEIENPFLGTKDIPNELEPGRLYLRTHDFYKPLHPWLLFRDSGENERVLFFNGMNGDAEYLDYVTGDVIRGQSLVSMFPTLIDDLQSSLNSTPELNNLAPVSPQKTETSRDGASVAEGKIKDSADLFGALAGLIGKPIDRSTPPTLVNPRVQPNSGEATIGHVILNRYEVRRVLGRGAFGQVLEVHDRDTGMDYALKRLPPELAGHEAQLKLIRTNFSLVSQLSHPHIATLRTIETDPANGQMYVLMDLVRGMDLCNWMADYQASGAEFSIELVLGIAEQIAAGLDFAHSRPINRGGNGKAKKFGVVHRDLKPANVMVEASEEFRPGVPRVRIVDFGLAAEIQASLFSLSTNHAPNVVGGTPLYMAPEQWQGRTITRGVDQWALAVMIYEMATGRKPFNGPTHQAIVANVIAANPERPDAFTDAQWKALKQTFQYDRKLRHRSCMALVKALAEAEKSTSKIVLSPVIPMPDEFESDGSKLKPKPSTWRKHAGIVALCILMLMGVGSIGHWSFREWAFKTDLAQVLTMGESGNQDADEALRDTINALDNFKQKYSMRPTEDLQSVANIHGVLKQREEMLSKRKRQFEALLSDAEQSYLSNPTAALTKLDAAERMGRPISPPNSLPDLISALNPSLNARRVAANERQFALELDSLEKSSQNALRADQGEIVAAINTLDDFIIKNRNSRKPEELSSIQDCHRKLEVRLDDLSRRKSKFKDRIDLAEMMLLINPEDALGKLDEAGEIGRPDAAKYYPDLFADLHPALEERKSKAKAAISQREQTFQSHLARANNAERKKDWSEVEKDVQEALASLGEMSCKDRYLAQGMNEKAKKMRSDFQTKMLEGDAKLKAGNFHDAENAYLTAKDAWPISPDIAIVEKGITSARDGILAERYSAAIKNGNEQLQLESWDTALTSFQEALNLRSDDFVAKKGIESANQGKSNRLYTEAIGAGKSALAQQSWDTAIKRFNDALAIRQNDSEAQYGLAMVDAGKAFIGKDLLDAARALERALQFKPNDIEANFALSFLNGAKMFQEKRWDKSEVELRKALSLKQNDKNVIDALEAVSKARDSALKVKGVLAIQNPLTGLTVNYSIRWKDVNGEWMEWKKVSLEFNKIITHTCVGATGCQVEFELNGATKHYDLDYKQAATDQSNEAVAAELFHFDSNGDLYKGDSANKVAAQRLEAERQAAMQYKCVFAIYNAATGYTLNYQFRFQLAGDTYSDWEQASLIDNNNRWHSHVGAIGAELSFNGQSYRLFSNRIAADKEVTPGDYANAKQNFQTNDHGKTFVVGSGDGSGHQAVKALEELNKALEEYNRQQKAKLSR